MYIESRYICIVYSVLTWTTIAIIVVVVMSFNVSKTDLSGINRRDARARVRGQNVKAHNAQTTVTGLGSIIKSALVLFVGKEFIRVCWWLDS